MTKERAIQIWYDIQESKTINKRIILPFDVFKELQAAGFADGFDLDENKLEKFVY